MSRKINNENPTKQSDSKQNAGDFSFLHRLNYAANADQNLAKVLSQDIRYKRIESSHLRNAWQYSTDIIRQANELLQPLQTSHSSIHSVVLAGSFGRMEGGKDSDFDFFVIAKDGAIKSKEDEKQLFSAVWDRLKVLPIEPPDSNGIFTRVVTPSILCDVDALGNLEYARHVFGLRMQLLTDSQPIYGSDAFQQLQIDTVRWYCQPDYSPFSNSALQYLLADLKRYFASYAIWHQYRFDKTFNDSWLMRQIKMHHSRLASYTALAISAITIASDHNEKGDPIDEVSIANELTNQLMYTPLERIIIHWPSELEPQLLEYITHYNRIAMLISDPELRKALINENPEHVRNGFTATNTPEPILFEIKQSIEKMRQLLTLCVTHTISHSHPSTAASWAL